MVSNGYATPEVLHYLRPHLDGYKIDLKSMNTANYRDMGGVLSRVLIPSNWLWTWVFGWKWSHS